MVEAARQFKPDLADDNEADALFILAWAQKQFSAEAA